MAKTASYREKHQIQDKEKSPAASNWIKENPDLWEIFKKPYSFEENFLSLPYNRQIEMIATLNNLIRGKNFVFDAKVQKILSEYAALHMENLHWLTGSVYEEGNIYFPIADDEKKLVRMECYGSINERRPHELSSCYKFFSEKALRYSKRGRKPFRLKDFDMDQSPMWSVFNQFESFRSIKNEVRRFLYDNNYNPDVLKIMSVNDFCDIIYKMSIAKRRPRGVFLRRGYKNGFVMRFMKVCGKDLFTHLINKNIDKRAAASLCRSMSLYGVCDIDSLVVTETHYTPKVIQNLAKNKYDVSSINVGDPIPEDMIRFLFQTGQENLIIALDEKGLPLDKSNLPRYEVHHKNAVKFSANNQYLACANYDENLMLVEHDIHQVYYHGSDRIIQVNNKNEYYFSRINVIDDTLCLIDGFNNLSDAFYADLANSSYMKHRRNEDRKHVVNYYIKSMERLNNIVEISDKYGVEYSKKNLTTERNQINEILEKDINISNEDLNVFSKWIKSKQGKTF